MSDSVMYNVLGRPVVTEKTTVQRENDNKYVFRVMRSANKIQIRQAVEALFGVKVIDVHTSRMPGKPKRRGRIPGRKTSWKKAVITLRQGDAIEFYDMDEAEMDGEA